MNGEIVRVSAALEHSLKCLAEQRGNEFSSIVGDIVRTNFESGRVQSFIERRTVSTISAYVERVVTYYTFCHDFVYQLQEEQDPLAWKMLLLKLRQWAYSQLWHSSFLVERRQHAMDCANDAAVVIATSNFPYDTSFSSWARVILRNTCLRYVRARTTGCIVPDEALVELDNQQEWIQNVPDQRIEETRRNIELRQALFQAIEQLTSSQRTFINMYYFEERDYDEVVLLTDKSKNTLYKLHHDALINLRRTWDENLKE